MTGRHNPSPVRGVEIVNLQKAYAVRAAPLLAFVRSLKRGLHLEKQEFNICFVDDNAIRRLNLAFRSRDNATDVLSFPWERTDTLIGAANSRDDGFAHFLGDIVISVESAGRNAASEGHSTLNELRWLILHGVLHLLGYDHTRDKGEMVALELTFRDQLGIGGERKKHVKVQSAKLRSRKIPRVRG
jgi:probable rRNA maturation factor